MKRKGIRIGNLIRALNVIVIMTLVSLALLAALCCRKNNCAMAAQLPDAGSVLQSYRDNPYIRFYEGNEGIAWTTVHPDGAARTSYGTYIYSGSQSIYREAEGTEVIPSGVVSRRELNGELPPGHHYYAAEITDSVIPVGRWVLMHRNAKCIHGPFEACRDYEYYGINGLPNNKCSEEYDSGWVAYCADCGEPLTGYVYTCADCVSRIGYIFAGSGEFAYRYPAEYLFFCPISGDNLENDVVLRRHLCNSFVSCNRYSVVYDGNGATSGMMSPSIHYFGGEEMYEGYEVISSDMLRENTFSKAGYVFEGWSDSPYGQVLFSDGSSCRSLESYFPLLRRSGEGSDFQTVTLYAVWRKCDTRINISGGEFNGNPGSYNGVISGTFTSGKNSFENGYMNETVVGAPLLGAPSGYRIELNAMEGTSAGYVYSSCEFSGWLAESSDISAESLPGHGDTFPEIFGRLSGTIKDLSSDGSFTYIHSSVTDGTEDTITAIWQSSSVTLPDAFCAGMVFEGWYTDPDLEAEHFAGRAGDLFVPGSDMMLYARFSGLELSASPDYMGNESFGNVRYSGLTRLSIPGASDCDMYRYYISPSVYPYVFGEAATEAVSTFAPGKAFSFGTAGSYSEVTVEASGLYSFELWGARGASYDRYSGENGEYQSCTFFLSKGDIVGIYTGIPGRTNTSSGSVICGGGEGSYISVNGRVVLSSSGGKGATYSLNVSRTFGFTGGMQTYTTPAEGDYTLQVWGAGGVNAGDDHPGAGSGGYASGTVHLSSGSVLYICVGGKNGYNGGGTGGKDMDGKSGGNGGGATHIASSSGLLSGLVNAKNRVYIVAGGGGGGAGAGGISGNGGGEYGGSGSSPWPGGRQDTTGGTQTGPGATGSGSGRGGFGYGGNAYSYDSENGDYPWILNGGGGGGWYGGGAGTVKNGSYGCGGGGGSGYIGGVQNGTMRTGGNSGNGYATISCNVNIMGQNATGYGTGFTPGSIPYKDHRVVTHSSSTYPQTDTAGNGYCIMKSPAVRYSTDSSVLVISPDLEAPDPVESVELLLDPEALGLNLRWRMPDDHGTGYMFMGRGYRLSDVMSGNDIYAQTQTENVVITTGVYSYFYLIDDFPMRSAEYVRNNGSRILTPWADVSGTYPEAEFTKWLESADSSAPVCSAVSIVPDGSDRYIHLIAVDRAGNASEVLNAPVDGRGAYIPYPVYTEKLKISESGNVYASETDPDTYYVRSDGKTPFTIVYSAYIRGFARDAYQVRSAFLNSFSGEYSRFDISYTGISEGESSADVEEYIRSAGFVLFPFEDPVAVRSDLGRRVTLTESFSTAAEGEIFIYPSAGALLEPGGALPSNESRVISSDRGLDILNGITLIGDASPPECMVSVCGGDYVRLPGSDISNVATECVIDRREDDVLIDLYVSDEGAGLKGNFKVRVVNLDNGLEAEFESAGEHLVMELKADSGRTEPAFEDMLYNGRFTVFVTAEDNVGNEMSESSERITELDIKGEIKRYLDTVSGPLTDETGEALIKRGESGYVHSFVWGYPDAVLVRFEDEMLETCSILYIPEGDDPSDYSDKYYAVRTLEPSEYMHELSTDFTVPLEYDGSVINVSVTAFKGDEELTWNASCNIFAEGSVLDEFTTVLRAE